MSTCTISIVCRAGSSKFVCWFQQKKKSALFEVAEVVPVMTNNYEENILRGVSDSSYSLESSIELLQKDVVQLHAPRYQSMRRVSDGRAKRRNFWEVGGTRALNLRLFSPFVCRYRM